MPTFLVRFDILAERSATTLESEAPPLRTQQQNVRRQPAHAAKSGGSARTQMAAAVAVCACCRTTSATYLLGQDRLTVLRRERKTQELLAAFSAGRRASPCLGASPAKRENISRVPPTGICQTRNPVYQLVAQRAPPCSTEALLRTHILNPSAFAMLNTVRTLRGGCELLLRASLVAPPQLQSARGYAAAGARQARAVGCPFWQLLPGLLHRTPMPQCFEPIC